MQQVDFLLCCHNNSCLFGCSIKHDVVSVSISLHYYEAYKTYDLFEDDRGWRHYSSWKNSPQTLRQKSRRCRSDHILSANNFLAWPAECFIWCWQLGQIQQDFVCVCVCLQATGIKFGLYEGNTELCMENEKWINICIVMCVIWTVYFLYTMRNKNTKKGKANKNAISLQTWADPEGSRRLNLPVFKTFGTWRW